MFIIRTLYCTTLCIILLSAAAVSGYIPEAYEPLEANYGRSNGLSSRLSFEDIVFVDPSNRPPVENLTAEECYILAGAQNKDDETTFLLPWHLKLSSTAAIAYEFFGYIPPALTPEVIHQIPGFEDTAGAALDYLRNPLTGEWPLLDATELSPGDAYIRPLTKEELIHLANNSIMLKKAWFEDKAQNPLDLLEGRPYMDCFTLDTKLSSDVYYVRIYGWDGVIYTNLLWQGSGEHPDLPDTHGEIVTVKLGGCEDCDV